MPRIVGEWFCRDGQLTTSTACRPSSPDAVYVRNNRRPDAGTAVFDHAAWAVFIASVKDGDYDL